MLQMADFSSRQRELMTRECKRAAMRRALLAALMVAVVAAMPASASWIEDNLAPAGVAYQEDASVHGDAPPTCELLDASRAVNLDDVQSYGMLVDYDDEADAYALTLEEASVGTRVGLDINLGDAAGLHTVSFDIRSPDCGSSVFDPDSAYYDPAPTDPYPNPPNGATVEADLTLDADECDESRWKFLGNQMGGIPAPATIYVEWTDGTYEYVPVVKSTPATIAMYVTTSNLGTTIERAVIVLPADYRGQFNLVAGPCTAVEGTPVEAPFQDPDALVGEFTVQEAGTHVILVTISERTADGAQELVPPLGTTRTCHYNSCLVAFQAVSFDMLAATA